GLALNEDAAFFPGDQQLAFERVDQVAADLGAYGFDAQAAHAVQIFVPGQDGDMHAAVPTVASGRMGFQRTTILLLLGMPLAVSAHAVPAKPAGKVHELWRAKLGVLVTDLDVTPNGQRILISARADVDAAPAELSALRKFPPKGAYTVLL